VVAAGVGRGGRRWPRSSVGRAIVITPATAPRDGWADAFRRMAEAGDDALLDETPPTDFDRDQWRW
jgi:hypothetical protein